MLKYNEVNPLAVFGLRRLYHRPDHLTIVTFTLCCDIKIISDWVWENLSGRFYLSNDWISSGCIIGFELPAEASYFSLMLDTFNKHEFFF